MTDMFVRVFPGKTNREDIPNITILWAEVQIKGRKKKSCLGHSIHFPLPGHHAVLCLDPPWHLSMMDGALRINSSLKFFLSNILVIAMKPNTVFYIIVKTMKMCFLISYFPLCCLVLKQLEKKAGQKKRQRIKNNK